MGALHHIAGGHHAIHEVVHMMPEGRLQGFKRIVGGQIAVVRCKLSARQQARAAVKRQLQHLVHVEHGRVAPAQVVALGGQLHAAHDGVIARVPFAHAQGLQRRDHRPVVEELGHAAALCHHADSLLEQRIADALVQPHRQVRLGQAQILLRLKHQEGERIGEVPALIVHAAQRHVEADGKAREILRAVGVAHVHDLVELQPQALDQLQRVLRVQAARLHVRLIPGPQNAIQPSRRERRGIGLHLENHEQEPQRLQRLVEALCGAHGQVFAVLRNNVQILRIVHAFLRHSVR